MIKRILLYFIPAIFSFFLFSCGRETIPAENIELGKEYFPTTVGHFIEYNVDSIIYNDFTQTNDSFKMQFRDEIAEKFYDNQQRESYIVHRYRRQDSTFQWEDLMTYYVTPSSFSVEVVENNLRFIKLIFPVKNNTRWYGNVYIPAENDENLKWLDAWDYHYTNINLSFNTGSKTFANSLVVYADTSQPYIMQTITNPEDDPDSYSNMKRYKEAYSKNIGLIYREITNWTYDPSIKKHRKGFTVYYRAYNHN